MKGVACMPHSGNGQGYQPNCPRCRNVTEMCGISADSVGVSVVSNAVSVRVWAPRSRQPDTVRVFVGYDSRQPVAAQVLAHSVAERSSCPVSITRLCLSQLPITRRGLTEFTYSRFLVPWLCGFEGYAVFVDSDFVFLGDVKELVAIAMLADLSRGPGEPCGCPCHKSRFASLTEGAECDECGHVGVGVEMGPAVWVAKNALRYEWASLMVFNCARCEKLTPEYVQDERNKLFDLAWADRIGDIPNEWNFLVGYDSKPDAGRPPRAIHYTQGIPCWPETTDCDYAEEWKAAYRASRSTVDFQALMGKSVHAEPVLERLRREA